MTLVNGQSLWELKGCQQRLTKIKVYKRGTLKKGNLEEANHLVLIEIIRILSHKEES